MKIIIAGDGKQIFTMRDVYSLSLMVNPEKQAAREIERLIKYPGFLQRDTFAKSRVEIVELRIDEGSKLCNVALNDLDSIIKCKVLVCAVSRKGVAQIPDGHFVLQEGDRVFVTAPSENLTILLKNLGVITHKAKRVIICGGGRIGYYFGRVYRRRGCRDFAVYDCTVEGACFSDLLCNLAAGGKQCYLSARGRRKIGTAGHLGVAGDYRRRTNRRCGRHVARCAHYNCFVHPAPKQRAQQRKQKKFPLRELFLRSIHSKRL